MLRTLNKYKKEYKSETDEDEKKKIHGKIIVQNLVKFLHKC